MKRERSGKNGSVSPAEVLPSGRLTTEGVCAKYGIAKRTLYMWLKKGFPQAIKGGRGGARSEFDPSACDEWMRVHGRGLLSQGGDLDTPQTKADADLALTLQKIRGARARADRDELALKQRRGEMLLAAEVEDGRLRRIAVVKAGLLALPGKVASRGESRPARELESIVHEEVVRLLTEYEKAFERVDEPG